MKPFAQLGSGGKPFVKPIVISTKPVGDTSLRPPSMGHRLHKPKTAEVAKLVAVPPPPPPSKVPPSHPLHRHYVKPIIVDTKAEEPTHKPVEAEPEPEPKAPTPKPVGAKESFIAEFEPLVAKAQFIYDAIKQKMAPPDKLLRLVLLHSDAFKGGLSDLGNTLRWYWKNEKEGGGIYRKGDEPLTAERLWKVDVMDTEALYERQGHSLEYLIRHKTDYLRKKFKWFKEPNSLEVEAYETAYGSGREGMEFAFDMLSLKKKLGMIKVQSILDFYTPAGLEAERERKKAEDEAEAEKGAKESVERAKRKEHSDRFFEKLKSDYEAKLASAPRHEESAEDMLVEGDQIGLPSKEQVWIIGYNSRREVNAVTANRGIGRQLGWLDSEDQFIKERPRRR